MIPEAFICGQRGYNGNKTELAFLTYKKLTGEIASENSFNSWLGVNSKNPEYTKTWFDNTPTAGITIKRTIGGHGGGWDTRQAYVRISDPRGFEVEITDENFIDICKESGITKGVLDGEFVYSFGNASRIYLVRHGSDHCNELMDETKRMIEAYNIKNNSPKFSFKNIKLGHKYIVNCEGNNGLTAIYIGKVKCIDPYTNKVANEHMFLVLNLGSNWWEHNTNSFRILRNANIVTDAGECFSEEECNKLTESMGIVDKSYNITPSITKNLGKGTHRSEEVLKWLSENYLTKKLTYN